MDTRSKSSRRRPLWAAAIVLLCALIMLQYHGVAADLVEGMAEGGASTDVQSWPSYRVDAEKDLKSFIRYIYMGSYGMYWELEGRETAPSELFLPGLEDFYEAEEFNQEFVNWYDSMTTLLASYGVEYQIVDRVSGEFQTASTNDLRNYEEGNPAFFLKMSYDENGSLELSSMKNQDNLTFAADEIGSISKRNFLYWMNCSGISASALEQPENVDIYIYSDDPDCYRSHNEVTVAYSTVTTLQYIGDIENVISTAYLVLLAVLAAGAFLLPMFRKLRRESHFLTRIPLEGAALICGAVMLADGLAVSMAVDYVQGGWTAAVEGEILAFLIYALLFGAWLVGLMSLLQILDVGWSAYWRDRSILRRNARAIWSGIRRRLRRLSNDLKTIDLSDRSDRWLFRIVAVNFVILFFCCLLWFWGVAGLLIYSLILFLILRKYLRQLKEKYKVLLQATSRMAQGDLQVEVKEELGPFEPMKEELAKVNSGFRKAVEQEIRSQNMKTELITNVSHDLKTPLTAIITYVNLLKEEGITEEERKNYVEILDRKSLRLKKLIEDLFEISKAASGNIQIEKTQVDLGEIVRQAAMEQEDRMEAADIDCRVQVPQERVSIMLDGEKTYRILDNLLVNVSKYGMAGTRAWVTLEADENQARITVKNISAQELDEDCSYLAERFVRGDKSRNTEGSGLGLAIVKSFTELQGGTFQIATDGDLFKAILTFPMK